jgi:quercetin dioxygenase-like cupin family protein
MLSMPMKALISALVVVGAVGLALLLERTESRSGEVKAKELLVADLVGEPGKEVNIQLYTFPPGASVPWHIHPDAHEFDYELDGALTLQTDGEGSKVLKRGDAVYVAPNVVHRGVNVSRTQAAKLFVVRVKPKDEPLTKEVQP